jgi:hypothetical protein
MLQLKNRYGRSVFLMFHKLENLRMKLAKTANHITFLKSCKSHRILPEVYICIS